MDLPARGRSRSTQVAVIAATGGTIGPVATTTT